MEVTAKKDPFLFLWSFDLPIDNWIKDKKIQDDFKSANPIEMVLNCPDIEKKYTGDFLITCVRISNNPNTKKAEIDVVAIGSFLEEDVKN